jgi:hypothetical protein
MSRKSKRKVHFSGVLAGLADAKSRMDEAALADENIHQLCGIVDDDGPDIEHEGATLALGALLASNDQLRARNDALIEDARAYGANSEQGATVYECHCIRNLVLAVVAVWDPETAGRVAEEREIHWPDPLLWPEGKLPRTLADLFATLAKEADEERVGALGQSWLDSGILPESLEATLRPLFKMFVDFRKEPAS